MLQDTEGVTWLTSQGCHVKNIAKCNESRNVALFQEGKRCQIFFFNQA